MTQPSRWELALGLCLELLDTKPSQMTGAKDYVSLELPAGPLCCYMKRSYLRMKPRIGEPGDCERHWERKGEKEGVKEKGREADREKQRNLGLEPDLPKGIWCFLVLSANSLLSLTNVTWVPVIWNWKSSAWYKNIFLLIKTDLYQ